MRADNLDDLGGIATFNRPRQLFYAADALSWLPAESAVADDYAHQAVAAYADPTQPDWDYGNSAASRADLALANIARGEIEGAIDALTPVFELPAEQRISLVVDSVNRVYRALTTAASSAPARELQERIEDYTRTSMRTLPR